MFLNNNDYDTILKYYKLSYKNKTLRDKKREARKILVTKLCRCIKKVKQTRKRNPIAICKSSVLKKKNLTCKKFKCKPKKLVGLKHETKKHKLKSNNNL